MATDRKFSAPRFRRDLDCSLQEADGRRVFIVKDPKSGRFFRFGAVEHFIIERLDGRTSSTAVSEEAEAAFGAELDQETLVAFVENLWQRGLLETGDATARVRRRSRIRGDLLYLRFMAFDPNRLFDRLVGKVRFFFTPAFLALSAGLVVLAILVLLGNTDEVARDLPRLFKLETLFAAWLIILLTTIAHEFAHGLTCKRFGGKVHEIGFLLLYFQPALYCNVSDAWLFPEKSRRLWVTFAGGYFELFLWALAILIWRVTAPETLLNYAALVMMATSGIRILLNLNPLIKLDGYYLLSDWLDVPNLRPRAFGYLRDRLRSLWRWNAPGSDPVSRRERRIYLSYGLFAGVFSFLLLGFIVSRIGGFLVTEYRGAGFVLFTGLLLVFFWRPLKRLVSRMLGSRLRRGTAGSVTRLVALLLCLGAAAVVLLTGRMELTIAGEFTVLPIHNADVRAQVEAIIDEIVVVEGDLVNQGDVVARLSDREFRAELKAIEAEILEKRARLELLVSGPRREEIVLARQEVEKEKTRRTHAARRYEEARQIQAAAVAKARSEVEKAREQYSYAKKERQRFRSLIEKKVIPQKRFDEVEQEKAVRHRELAEARANLNMLLADTQAESHKELAVAEMQFVEAQAKLGLLLAGSRREEIKAAEAEIARLEARRGFVAEQIQLAEVVSPITGVVTTPKPHEMIGHLVEKGDLILEIYDYQTVIAEIYVPEKEMADVRIGQEVVLKARAYPDESFTGQVTGIASTAMQSEDGLPRKIIRVSTMIANPSLKLRPEMTGYAKIYGGKRRIIDIMTRRLVRYLKVEFWSWW